MRSNDMDIMKEWMLGVSSLNRSCPFCFARAGEDCSVKHTGLVRQPHSVRKPVKPVV